MNESIYNKSVCRKAPATPGLLIKPTWLQCEILKITRINLNRFKKNYLCYNLRLAMVKVAPKNMVSQGFLKDNNKNVFIGYQLEKLSRHYGHSCFWVGTAKNLILSDSKLNKNKSFNGGMACTCDRLTAIDKLFTSSDLYYSKFSMPVTLLKLKRHQFSQSLQISPKPWLFGWHFFLINNYRLYAAMVSHSCQSPMLNYAKS